MLLFQTGSSLLLLQVPTLYWLLTVHSRTWNHLSVYCMGTSWVRDSISHVPPHLPLEESNGSRLLWASHLKISTSQCLTGSSFIPTLTSVSTVSSSTNFLALDILAACSQTHARVYALCCQHFWFQEKNVIWLCTAQICSAAVRLSSELLCL